MVKFKRKVEIKAPSAKELIEEMEHYLPIPMYLMKSSVQSLKEQGLDISPDQQLLVTGVMDSGDVGGVMCQIEWDEKQNIVISLTQLMIKPEHPLSLKVLAYQRHRIKKLARQARKEEEW